MSLVINNPKYENYFQTTWNNYLRELDSKNISLPRRISPGFLQELAAKNDLCYSVFKINGEYTVCGRNLKEFRGNDLWTCHICEDLQEKLRKRYAHTSGNEVPVSE